MKDAEKKADRLLQIEAMLLMHPEGLSQAEIARRLGVNRSTVNRYLPSLSKCVYIDTFDSNKWKIDRSAYLVNVRFNLHEATAIHLAARLLATRMDRQNPHAAAALRKLGVALELLAPHISTHLGQAADVMDGAAQLHDPNFLRTLEQLTLAWAEGRKVQVWHRHTESGKVYEYRFSPYFIEPYAIGQAVHVIGFREPPGELRTFKVERIERVEMLNERYEIPERFDPTDLLSSAWGVWYTEGEPVEVVLKFSPRVAGRVQETRWHRSQQMVRQPDGSLLWRAFVAEPQEMLPWVRSWGSDVEVVEPDEMRERLIEETQALTEIYGLKTDKEKPFQISSKQAHIPGKQIYFAHSNGPDQSKWQQVKDHLANTARIAKTLGQSSRTAEYAYVAAYLHDVGKYSLGFQKRLQGGKRVDHATAGAKVVKDLFTPEVGKLLAYCIAGHHGGLPDYGSEIDADTETTLQARLKKEVEDYSHFAEEIDVSQFTLPRYLPIQPTTRTGEFSLSFFTRMVYSTLVDADFLETETFMNNGQKPRGGDTNVDMLANQFNQFLEQFKFPQSPINQQRTNTLKTCIAKATDQPGLFTLSVPTGGGKTFSSMAFALRHAAQHGMERIIYVIPYTSIIEQNAAEFKASLGIENVLEHHSNFDWKQDKADEKIKFQNNKNYTALQKLKLASENWDIPIVVTTNVQFFESLFANRSSRCRKLHNIAKSVIIFDEAQMLPTEYLKPCLTAVYELVKNYGTSAVFCTATQPCVEQFLPKGTALKELMPDPQALYRFYQRVKVTSAGKLKDIELADRINQQQQTLCIVNTRKHAKGLFESVDENGRFHLSTLMCPAHRRETITTLKTHLKNGLPCRVISTQIMEAGIDVDFPTGYRAIAGLDSIIQAAGRVNREGKKACGELIIFEPDSDFVKRVPSWIEQGAALTKTILRNYSDPICLEAIKSYYTTLYDMHDERDFDPKGIMKCFEKGLPGEMNFDFMSAAEKFRVIESPTVAVIIPYNQEAENLLEFARMDPYPKRFSRELQLYTVNIYEQEFESLQSQGLIDFHGDIFAVLNNMDYYDHETGLKIPESASGEGIFI